MKNKVVIMILYSLLMCNITYAKEQEQEQYSSAKDSESYNKKNIKREDKREEDKEKNRNIRNKLKFIGSF